MTLAEMGISPQPIEEVITCTNEPLKPWSKLECPKKPAYAPSTLLPEDIRSILEYDDSFSLRPPLPGEAIPKAFIYRDVETNEPRVPANRRGLMEATECLIDKLNENPDMMKAIEKIILVEPEPDIVEDLEGPQSKKLKGTLFDSRSTVRSGVAFLK